ncbi:hypothetical protein CO661_14135 [Sinorhizobium fredii]|uniref:Uncharacterized protein n=1 Tax=Rhizobium fredii TaxID=380 RepID=A0A2A6LYA6_RHIFR|nr:hypothetical protein [Sinorhizobium fredii]PDT47317.1 hypothetical protein CO661_14135 [Sinorhizobium fredii]
MTLAEFKAWFEGFTEDMDGAPNEKQWKRIKARVKDIDGVAITKTVFIDRYVTPYRPYWSTDMVFGASGGVPVGTTCMNAVGEALASAKAAVAEFDSQCAMLDLGKAEYKAVLNA